MKDVFTGIAGAVFAIISIVPFHLTNNAQPSPYMDEIFHVPQAQRFCDGNFSYWDPMITTLPGLYLSSLVILKPLTLIPSTNIVCSTHNLRAVNIIFMTLNMILLYLIIQKLHSKNKIISRSMIIANAWILSFFPILYFFTWLYYTDPGAVFFTLLMYYLNLCDHHFLSAMAGVFAVVFRQTNIVWVIFVMGLAKGRQLLKFIAEEKKDISKMSDFKVLYTIFNLYLKTLRFKPSRAFELKWNILKSCFWYMIVLFGFASFVYINGSIVVGDKSHHSACFNIPQIFYFLSVTLVFSIMHLASPSKLIYFFRFSIQSPVRVSLFVLLSYYAITHYTYVHEYLLADNRHYPFYVWMKIYRRHDYVKYGLIPVYLYSAISVSRLLETRDIFWKLCFVICLFACTVPQKLLEFRYFIIPYLIFRVNISVTSKFKLFIEFLLYTTVNILTVYIYLFKTFKWENSVELQRFMW
ncbi:hypothetical protein LOTGIDRAFT_223840 [Lottia gigantea]|uniref:Dol-P-Glc:Glc(2)Man(9)GlcNAc(2)-PP-Dol alpha-1,2-glucosyltransferase n=1 Tax=Lottia gigantea TaxID=225164 RepID=V4AK76_LOTGI|nr:hypothetical protein LOTGIDRAFT_223840 [Lottia gigantea]ESP04599.1 hypothetical protein LOTGIDRAFT_223840 [Lottia gigantea]